MSTYDTATMLAVYRVQKVIPPFWSQFFPTTITFDTDTIDFDKVFTDDRKLAPFVAPNVQGQIMSQEGYNTRYFKPAYVKPKHAVDPNMVIPRQAGEALGTGSLSLGQRRNVVIAELTRKHKAMHANRWEWMAAKAIQDGMVTIAGENYPSTTVDFLRDPSLTVVLTGAAKWDQTTGTPLVDIQNARVASNDLSNGRPTRLIFGANAWALFCKRVDIREAQNKFYGGQNTALNLIPAGYTGVEYIGNFGGTSGESNFDVYVDTSKYRDPDTNALTFFLDQNTVVGMDDTAIGGVRAFGAIKDFDANFQALDVYIKMYREQDPSVEFVLSQSAPLLIPREPNSTFSIKVA